MVGHALWANQHAKHIYVCQDTITQTFLGQILVKTKIGETLVLKLLDFPKAFEVVCVVSHVGVRGVLS